MRPRLDPALAGLVRALRTRAGGMAAIVDAQTTPWSSMLFDGGRHHLALRLSDAGTAHRVATALEAADFVLDGHLVADIADVSVVGDTLALTALTVRDGAIPS